ncbi:MAG: polysaccharide deacetylase family protein [Oscillospiraceae bacterium]|nr:polysaccharide deacetylase family protein [Oscillospiraceae bacterium]
MTIKKLYPNGKKKAFNITYDDGVWQDVRFVQLLDKYDIKGTFNLNSQLMAREFQWIHPNGMTVKRLSPQKAVQLYKNHEVASHTLTHPYMHDMSREEILYQLGQDKYNLEQLFGRKVAGFAVPFDFYSNLISDCAKECGFEYARCSEERYSYTPPKDYWWWAAGAYHINPTMWQFAENFFETDEELALCQIVGHSYDLDAENMWAKMENLLKRVGESEDVVSMTNLELVRYLKAMDKAETYADCIVNHSDTELWFEADGKTVAVGAWQTLQL